MSAQDGDSGVLALCVHHVTTLHTFCGLFRSLVHLLHCCSVGCGQELDAALRIVQFEVRTVPDTCYELFPSLISVLRDVGYWMGWVTGGLGASKNERPPSMQDITLCSEAGARISGTSQIPSNLGTVRTRVLLWELLA